MSITFGILIKSSILDNPYMDVSERYIEHDNDTLLLPIAFRSNSIRFINPIAHLLPDELEVYAMDNSSQGINCVGDIKKQITL
jgi:hypothetical protein